MSLLQRLPQAPAPNQPQAQVPPRPGSSNPFGLGGPRPNGRVQWEIIASADLAVRFDLSALSPDIFALAGLPVPETAPAEDGVLSPSLAEALSAALEKNPEAEETLKRALDEAWDAQGFTGAALVYPWREEARTALVTRLEASEQTPAILRATDPLLVLNILSRARTHVLIANAPPGLERAFLERSLFLDDPRILALAQTTGALTERLVEPEAEDEKLEEEA